MSFFSRYQDSNYFYKHFYSKISMWIQTRPLKKLASLNKSNNPNIRTLLSKSNSIFMKVHHSDPKNGPFFINK